MWRMGFDSPENFDDDQTYCGSVESQSEGFMLIPAVIITAEAGAFSGVQTADVVESVEILGTTFLDNMKHLLVKHTTNNPPSLSVIYFFKGKFATGTIVRNYEPGSWIPVIVDITTNHGGYFIFKLCPNNDITQDPSQPCFDQHVLEVERD